MALSKLTKVQTLGIGSNIEVVGVITTGQFKSGTSNLHSTGVELTNLNVSGIATIGGNLSIGGTLTYQDVTNIDSVGLITARAGVNVSGGQLDVGSNIKIGNAGVITATSFVGSGANLTGLPAQTTINSNTDNYLITGTGTANTLQGEANLTYGGGNLQFTTTANGQQVLLKSTGNYYNKLSFDSGNTSAGGSLAFIDFSWDGDKVADIFAVAGSDTTNKDDGHLVFRTSASQGSITERLRIKSNGQIILGSDGTNSELTFSQDGTSGVILNSTTTGFGGYNTFTVNSASFVHKYGSNERLRIASNGDFGFNDTSPTANASGNDTVLSIKGKGSSYSGKIDFKDSSGNIDNHIASDNAIFMFNCDPNSQNGNTSMLFSVHGSERFRFGRHGQLGIAGANYGAARQVMVSNGSSSAVSWSSNPFLLDMDSLGDLDYDGVFLRYREVNVSGNGLVYLGLCKSTTNCPAGRIGCPVGYVPGVVYNSQFRVDKVGITPWPDGSGHRYEYFAIISDYVSAGKLGIFYLTNSTN